SAWFCPWQGRFCRPSITRGSRLSRRRDGGRQVINRGGPPGRGASAASLRARYAAEQAESRSKSWKVPDRRRAKGESRGSLPLVTAPTISAQSLLPPPAHRA